MLAVLIDSFPKWVFMFDDIIHLRQLISLNGEMDIPRVREPRRVSFEWFPVASTEEIVEAVELLGQNPPEDYISFLREVSNGAVLFYDVEYGQSGYKLYGIQELVELQEIWQQNIPETKDPKYIAFGEFTGQADVLLFDLSRPSKQSNSSAVVIGGAIDPVEYWRVASRSFHEWLEHLVAARGRQYWEWR
jgi:hypothetical protein